MRPAPDRKKCLLCRYSASNQYGDLRCLFLFEMMLFHRTTPKVDCPMKDISNDL